MESWTKERTKDLKFNVTSSFPEQFPINIMSCGTLGPAYNEQLHAYSSARCYQAFVTLVAIFIQE